jgi:hypothetical protein
MKLKHITLIISAIVLLGFTACQELTNPVDTGTTPEYAIVLNDAVEIDGDLATTQVVECSLETGAFVPGDETIFENCRFDGKDMGKGFPPRKGNPKERPIVGKVMREMELTEAQIELLKGFNQAHRDCIQAIMQTWREAVAPIIEEANAERKLIMDDLKGGIITREEAREQLKALNEAMRAEIDALGMKDAIKIAIEDCNKTFIADIKSILTAEQLVIWEKYFPNK